MSRIGKKPVALPKGVTASVEGQTVKVKGPKGELSVKLAREVSVKLDEHGITVTPDKTQERAGQMWGLSRSLVNNLVVGVTQGFTQKLEIELKYHEGEPVIRELKRISTPGRRVYSSVRELKPHRQGLGVSILSTPQGLMTDSSAREKNVGGEVLCQVF